MKNKSLKILPVVVLIMSVIASGCATQVGPPAAGCRYLSAEIVENHALLPAPPANTSDITRSEIEHMLALQAARTAADVRRLNAEGTSVTGLFAGALGDAFKSNSLPATQSLLTFVAADAQRVISATKVCWKRPRPWVVDARIQPCIAKPTSFSYPSDRAALSRVWAVVLCELFPARKEALLARGEQLAQDRVLAGVHFPSDIEAGKKLGQMLATRIMQSPVFQADLAAAQVEIAKASPKM